MPDLTDEDGTQVNVRRAVARPLRPGRVVLIVGNATAILTPVQASQLAGYLTSVADIVEKGEDRG